MDKEIIIHDLAMACLTVEKIPCTDGVDYERTVKNYINSTGFIRDFLEEHLEENQD